MVISPLNDDDIFSPVPDDVPAFIVILSFVLELDFIAGSFGAVDADIEDVVTLTRKVKLKKPKSQPLQNHKVKTYLNRNI